MKEHRENSRSWLQEADQAILNAIEASGEQGVAFADLQPVLQEVVCRFFGSDGPDSFNDLTDIINDLKRNKKVEVGGKGYKITHNS